MRSNGQFGPIPIDRHIRSLVEAVNHAGCRTLASCHGHLRQGTTPYVLFEASMDRAMSMESLLRQAWGTGSLHYEWAIHGHFDDHCRLRFCLRLFALETDLEGPCLSVTRIRQDLISLARMVGSPMFPGSVIGVEGEERHEEKKDRGERSEVPNLFAPHFQSSEIPLTDGPRTWMMPTNGAFQRRIRNFFAAFHATHQGHGIPYSLATEIRGESIESVSAWSQSMSPDDPLGIAGQRQGGLRCVGHALADGWPPLCGANQAWVLWMGNDPIEWSQLAWAVRKQAWADPRALKGILNSSVRFDVILQPVLVVWGRLNGFSGKEDQPDSRNREWISHDLGLLFPFPAAPQKMPAFSATSECTGREVLQ